MKNQYHLKDIIKKLFFITLIFLILPCFVFGASRSTTDTKGTTTPVKTGVNKKRVPVKPTKKIAKPKFQRVEIIKVDIGTYPSGVWFWKATVKNTGSVELDKNLVVQGLKKRLGQNTWKKDHSSVVGNGFLPNQTRIYERKWTRCCKTSHFKVEIRDNANNTILDSKMYFTSLTTTIPQPNGASIKRIEWNDTTKQWRATLFSGVPWTLKFVVQGYLRHNGLSTPAGGSQVTIRPNGEVSTIWLHATGAQHGDQLRVHIKNLMPNCNDSNKDCGFEQYEYIIIPNSSSF